MFRLFSYRLKKIALLSSLSAASIGMMPAAMHAAPSAAQASVQINDQVVAFPDATPFVDLEGRLQVPLRFVSESLGFQVDWGTEGQNIQVTLSKGDKKVSLTTGQSVAEVNGSPVSLDTKAVFENGRVYVPLRFIADASQTPVKWDNPTRTAILGTDGKLHMSKAPLPYKAELDCVASAYSATPSENGGYGGLDYFGNTLAVGTVAVDPSVIPLGSKLYIEGYSFDGLPVGGMTAYATDIGGAIKGSRIDIFVPGSPQKLQAFGFQKVKVFVMS